MRKFCEEAANRHIPVCAKKAKETAMKSGKGGKAPVQNATQAKFHRQSTSQAGFSNPTSQQQLSGTARTSFKKGLY